MRERSLIICDDDRDFVARLGGFVSRREEGAFRVVCFSDREKMKEYVSTHEVDAVFAGESWEKAEFCGEKKRWFRLMETANAPRENAEPFVYKYQAAEEILRQVMLGLELPGAGQPELCTETDLFGVYAPGGWTECTRLALTMAKHLGRDGPAVYLGLNEFSAVIGLLGRNTDQDLSDLAYCWRRGRLDEEQLERMVIHLEGYDCVPAPANPAELAELKESESKDLVEAVCRAGGYRYAVLDFGGSISGWLSLFGSVGKNCVLFPATETGSLQQEAYEAFWRSIGADSIAERSKGVMLPLEELRGSRRERTEEYMDELAERLLRSAEDVERSGGAIVC